LNSGGSQADEAYNREGDTLEPVEPWPGEAEGAPAAGVYLGLWHGKCRKMVMHTQAGPAMPKPALAIRIPRSLVLRSTDGNLGPKQ
jgi:hypothetical protein